MAENNQVNGQSGEPSVSFDSNKIAEKERVEQFTNISGEKERQAAAERAKRAAEKKQEAIRNAKIEQEIETRKFEQDSAKIERRQNNILYRIFWNGWHKIISIILILAIIAVGAFFAWKYLIPHELSAEERARQDKEAFVLATKLSNEVEQIMLDYDVNENAYNDAEKKFTEKLEGASDIEKIYISTEYANFVYQYSYDADKSLSILSDVEPLLVSNAEKKEFYRCRGSIYELQGNYEKSNADMEIVNGL